MILSKREILDAVESGKIVVSSVDESGEMSALPLHLIESNVGPNSFDVTLSGELKVYVDSTGEALAFDVMSRHKASLTSCLSGEANKEYREILSRSGAIFDPKNRYQPHVKELTIPDEGLLLLPGVCYLGSTLEVVGSDTYVPVMYGRSSLGRVFFEPHCVAGFGDVGFKQRWTLEIMARLPLVVYKGMRVAQIAFYSMTDGDSGDAYDMRSTSKYVSQAGATPTRLSEDAEFK